MKLIDLLSSNGYIVVNKSVLRELGSDGAIVFGELCAEYQYFAANSRLDEDGFFYSTIENIERSTGIKRKSQTVAFADLQRRGLITVNVRGMPAQRHIRLNEEEIAAFISGCSSLSQTDKQVCPERTNKFVPNGQTSLSQTDKLHNIYTTTTKFDIKINNNKLNNNNIYLTESSDSASESSIRYTSKEFEELWKIYPRKEGKQKALAAYSAAVKQGVTFETVRDGIERYKKHIAAKHIEPRYIKQGSTWFNGRCWQDEYHDESTTEYESSFDTDEFFKAALESNYGKGYFDDD